MKIVYIGWRCRNFLVKCLKKIASWFVFLFMDFILNITFLGRIKKNISFNWYNTFLDIKIATPWNKNKKNIFIGHKQNGLKT